MTELNVNNEDKKIKLLIIGIIMNCAGTEKSFLAFANTLDYSKYDVTLLLAKKEGKLIDKIQRLCNGFITESADIDSTDRDGQALWIQSFI